MLVFEWTAPRHTRRDPWASFPVKDEPDKSPVGTVEIPQREILRARVRGGWWAPRLQLWAREPDAFDRIPGARPGTLTLRIRRQDRAHAHAIAEAITPAGAPADAT
jgi:hypothetical protein